MSNTNPTVAEIREWAYSGAPWPVEEWDLFLSWTGEVELFIELATDHSCPHRVFFLHMLYYVIGATYTSPDEMRRLPAFPGTPKKVEQSTTVTSKDG